MSTASPIKTNEQVRLNPIVFFGSTALILVLTAALILYPDSAGALLGRIQAWLSHSFGWYYMLAIGAYLFFVAWVAFSRFGTLKLGEEHEKPDFSYGAWAGMLFSSGIGISLLYFAASEPIDHLYHPPEGVPGSPQAARQALQLTFLHWGLHGWAIYPSLRASARRSICALLSQSTKKENAGVKSKACRTWLSMQCTLWSPRRNSAFSTEPSGPGPSAP